MQQVTEYNVRSSVREFETLPFNIFHKAEIQNGNITGRIADRNEPASLSRLEALELINKWNRMTGNSGTIYTIAGSPS